MSNIDVFSEGIKQIYETRGEEAFLNARLFHALLDDIIPTLTNERKIFRSVIDDSFLKELSVVFNSDKSNKQFEAIRLKKKIEDNNGLSEKWSSFIVESFTIAAGVKLNAFSEDDSKTEKLINNSFEAEYDFENEHSQKVVLPNGCIYEGNIRNGLPYGVGKKIWKDGAVYIGEFVNGDFNGIGKLTWTNGDVYEGDFINDKRTGKGKFIWANGDVYEGDFINDKRTGKGEYTFASGSIYEGDFVNGDFNGIGKLTWTNGDVYEGDFINDKRTGKGKFIWANGDVYEGDFINDKRTGKGKFIWANGDVYEGDFTNNKRTGKGEYTFASGNIYEGDFVDGDFNGIGKFIWANGDVYEGDFINGKRTGKGKYIWANGDVYEGEFINGKIIGNGTVIKNGVRQSGYFEDGVLKSSNEQSLISANNSESENFKKKKLLIEKKEALTKELKSLGIFDVKKKMELKSQLSSIELELILNSTDEHLKHWDECEKGINKKKHIMTVCDCFSIKGRGTVLVGKLICERLNNGDTIIVNEKNYVVTAIEMNKKILKYAEFGDYISVLARGLDSRDITKGDFIYMEMK